MVSPMLSREEVLKIARLARLDLSPAEVELYQTRIARVLDYIKELNELPTTKDAVVKHIPKDSVAFREDMPVPFKDQKALMANAPESESNHFILPTTVERS